MKNLNLLIPFLKNYKKTILLGLVFVTMSNISSVSIPFFVGKTVDIIRSEKFQMPEIYNNIIIILGLVLSSGFFMYWTRRTIIVVSRKIEYDLRKDYLNKILGKNQKFFDNNSTGSLMALATNDVSAARDFFGPAVMYAANTFTTFIFALIYMLQINISMTLIVLSPLPFLAYFVFLIGKKIHIAFKSAQAHYALMTAQAQESFSGIRVIKSYLREEYESNEFSKLSQAYIGKNLKLAKYQALMFPILMLIVGISQILILSIGGNFVMNNTLSFGELTQFFIYLNLLIWPIAAIGWISNVLQRADASAARLNEKVFSSLDNIEIKGNANLALSDTSIAINGLHYKFGEQIALNNISILIKKGESLGISGAVGSGKSVLANILSGLYLEYTGSISIGGHELESIGASKIRDLVTIVRQEPFLFSMTIEENLRFANSGVGFDKIVEICKRVKLHEEILTFPAAYSTLLGERGITLSGGQKQRLAIATALLRDTPIIILDDSLSAVDSDTEKFIANELREILANKTIIIISHRLSTLKDANNIVVMDKGSIIERGTHESLLALKGNYYSAYSAQELEQELAKID